MTLGCIFHFLHQTSAGLGGGLLIKKSSLFMGNMRSEMWVALHRVIVRNVCDDMSRHIHVTFVSHSPLLGQGSASQNSETSTDDACKSDENFVNLSRGVVKMSQIALDFKYPIIKMGKRYAIEP
jgi:hypothetical protein